jgi:hypothetical protein
VIAQPTDVIQVTDASQHHFKLETFKELFRLRPEWKREDKADFRLVAIIVGQDSDKGQTLKLDFKLIFDGDGIEGFPQRVSAVEAFLDFWESVRQYTTGDV